MTTRAPIHPGTVDWSGENPGMCLKEEADGPFGTLASFSGAALAWGALGEPFLVALPPEKSATGRHEMWSLFVEAERVNARVNGRPLRGRPFPRDFAGRRSSTAFLAFSETWVRPRPCAPGDPKGTP